MCAVSHPVLLAKSVTRTLTPSPSATLVGHLGDVGASAEAILTTVGQAMLTALGLDPDGWLKRLEKSLLLAAWLHDLGKVNNQFQRAVWGGADRSVRQTIRHEWISVWIATQPQVKEWLLPAVDGCEKCWLCALCAVAGHHPKLNRTAPTDHSFGANSTTEVSVLVDHPDFMNCLQQLQTRFNLDPAPKVEASVYRGAGDQAGIDRFMQRLNDLRDQWKIEFRRQPEWEKLCAVVKAALVAADVAGSALWEKIEGSEERADWIKSSLARMPSKADLEALVAARLGSDPPREFQQKIAHSTADVTLVEAGCGSGKTVAAYMWAAQQQANRRLWFCYPTTGTATEGFRGYLFGRFGGDEIRADLFHSRKEFDIKRMLESQSGGDYDPTDEAIRVQSLQAWDTQIVNCTVDNVLCLLQNLRRGLYAWPALAQSAIVFDEVHCYDRILFGNLLTWLEHLVGIPVLLMTASLPGSKRQEIREVCEHAGRTFNHIPHGPPELETLPRYRQATDQPLASAEVCVSRVAEDLERGGRILWISNTVDRTKAVGDVVLAAGCQEPIYYHSRFVYKDRTERHDEVVGLFESEAEAGFASTSQVAEMSLDLGYATLLITELAPIPAMIQRLGRLNRRAKPEIDPLVICDFIVVEPTNEGEFSRFPYELEELELAREWLRRLGQSPLSQADLVRNWHALGEAETLEPESSGWLSGGIDTPVDFIREDSFGISVICHRHFQQARVEGTAGYVLPMNHPPHNNWRSHRFPLCGFPIASDETIEYDEQKGAKWASHNIF